MTQNKTPWWHPGCFAQKSDNLARRMAMVKAIRNYFDQNSFAEVETPALQVSPGLEPHLKAFATTIEDPLPEDGKQSLRPHYLHTSPEFAMKKLLVAGMPRIYQFARVFRNGERSEHHHPEFVMLEWYRAHRDYNSLMDDCDALLKAAACCSATGSLSCNGAVCDVSQGAERISVLALFAKKTGIDLAAITPDMDSMSPDPAPLAKAAQNLGYYVADNDRWDDIFFRLWLDKIEPQLGMTRPVIVYDYPLCMAALSRPKPGTQGIAERFELYVCGMELANAFSELTDAKVQEQRFVHDMDLKEQLYGIRYPIDRDFIDALDYGMPESAGIALGIDRLAMLVCGAECIEDVLFAPVA